MNIFSEGLGVAISIRFRLFTLFVKWCDNVFIPIGIFNVEDIFLVDLIGRAILEVPLLVGNSIHTDR